MVICGMHIMRLIQFKLLKSPVMVGSNVLIGALRHCALFHFIYESCTDECAMLEAIEANSNNIKCVGQITV